MSAQTVIAVMTNGWVVVGHVEDWHDRALVLISSGTIRIWGTKEGLGELVHGPKSETVVDLIPTRTTVMSRNILFVLEVDGWEKVLLDGRG